VSPATGETNTARQYEAVIFDVGGVLVESPFQAALRWQQRVGLPDEALLTLMTLFSHYSAVAGPGEDPHPWHRVETGELPVAVFLDQAKAEVRAQLGPDQSLPDIGPDDLNVYLDVPALWPTVALVRDLRAEGYRTAICTNNVKEWAGWRASLPIDLFDVVVDSSEVGLRKPDPAIYRLTCDLLEVEPAAAVFCDDHPDNVAAAGAAGLTAVHITDDLVASLAALRRVLG
jgi:putative hydrolase of the HAD superfamily